MYEDIERKIEIAKPLTQEILDKLEGKTTDFGNEIKVGDKILHAMYMNKYIHKSQRFESDGITEMHIAIFKFVESEFPLFKEKFPRFIVKEIFKKLYTYSTEDLYQEYVRDGGTTMEDILILGL